LILGQLIDQRVQCLAAHTPPVYSRYGSSSRFAITIFHGQISHVWNTPHL
jgi:hypothetical protein